MSGPLKIGKYRHRVTVRNPPVDASRDLFGGRVGTGTTVITVWAEKQDWTGLELNEANRETASITTKWKVRYRTDILPKMQLVHGSDVYEILNVLDFDGTKREPGDRKQKGYLMKKVTLTKDNLIRGSYWPIGSTIDVSEEDAQDLIAKKQAFETKVVVDVPDNELVRSKTPRTIKEKAEK